FLALLTETAFDFSPLRHASRFSRRTLAKIVTWKEFELVFGINSSSHKDGNGVIGDQVSEYPFGFYGLLKNQQATEVRKPSPSMSHPPGFTPEVRCEEERRGSVFYPSNARVFNNFISSSGLVDVRMEGYSFTWAHPLASKSSKLDRFLVSE
nr:RNA-directed DNA polymerase, eukaryota [Tanacetum cinerariifolium]